MPEAFSGASILDEVAHRPWPMPSHAWMMRQSWRDLLFAHWPVDPDNIARHIPAEFAIDLFGGQAWLGIVPFCMTDVAPRGVPAVPWLSHFPEINVRTYVSVGDKPGVFFFSLDAGNRVAARVARWFLNLPYFAAEMRAQWTSDELQYRSRRRHRAPAAEFVATYGPCGAPFHPIEGSLEYFLTERYCLYARDHRARPYRLEIHHPPWSLQPAMAVIAENSMALASGIHLPNEAPLVHFVKRQDMVAWAPVRLVRM